MAAAADVLSLSVSAVQCSCATHFHCLAIACNTCSFSREFGSDPVWSFLAIMATHRKTSIESFVDNCSELRMIICKPLHTVIECLICPSTQITNPSSITTLSNHLNSDKHIASALWKPQFDVSIEQMIRLSAYQLKYKPDLAMLQLDNHVYLECIKCAHKFTSENVSKLAGHFKSHKIEVQQGEHATVPASVVQGIDSNSPRRAPKRKWPTDKDKVIRRELERDKQKGFNVLAMDSEGDLVCKLCPRKFKPANYRCYRESIEKHIRSNHHLIWAAIEAENIETDSEWETDEDGDGYVSPTKTPPKKRVCVRQISPRTGQIAVRNMLANNLPMSSADKQAKPMLKALVHRDVSPSYLRQTALPQFHQGN